MFSGDIKLEQWLKMVKLETAIRIELRHVFWGVFGHPYGVCLKNKTLCIWRFSPFSSSFPRFLRSIGEFGAKKYFTDHHTPNTIHDFRDSFPVRKMHDSRRKKFLATFHFHSSDASNFNL